MADRPLAAVLLVAFLLASLLASLLAGCGSGGEAGMSTTTQRVSGTTVLVTLVPPAPSTTVVADEDPTEAILEAHQGFWDTWLAANDPPDPDHPGLRRYYTGAAYEHAVASIRKNKEEGLHLELPSESLWKHTVLSVEVSDGETSAVLHDCAIDDGLIVRTATGDVLNDDVVTVIYVTELTRSDDTWRVVRNASTSRTEGATCDDSLT